MKKIPVFGNTIDSTYTTFDLLKDGHIAFEGSIFNYDPNDTTKKGRRNIQSLVDTCKSFPGLTAYKWQELKKN